MRKGQGRPQKLGDLIQRELELLQRELRDPRVGMITITGVDVSRTSPTQRFLYRAREAQAGRSARGPEARRGFLRSQLARRIKLYTTPELRFEYDESVSAATGCLA